MPTTPLERWRGRLWRMFAAGCVLLLIFHFTWAWYANRAITRWKDDARKHGLPLSVEESLVPDPEDDSVAFGRLVRAVKAISTTAQSPAVTEDARSSGGGLTGWITRPTLSLAGLKIPDHLPFPPKWIAAADASEEANAAAFDLGRQARAMGGASGRNIPYDLEDRDWAYEGPIKYALTLRDSAELHHVRGHDLQAIERLLDLMHAADVLRQHPESSEQNDSDKFTQFAADSALFMSPGLALDGEQSSSLRVNVRSLIVALLHPDPWNPRTISHMRAWYLIYADCIINDDLRTRRKYKCDVPDVAGSLLLRPAFQTMELHLVRRYDQFAPAVGLENWPALRDYPFRRGGEWPNSDDHIAWLRDCLGNRLEIVAQRRAAAISLAARLYVADNGRWPGSLDELVPKYLPHVPANPLMSDGNAMGYIVLKAQVPGGADRPLVHFGEQPIEFSNGIPVDLPQARGPLLPRTPGPLLPRNLNIARTHAYFDLSRFTTGSP